MGRSGTLFAYQQENIEPDIIALAKGLGGGFPVGAVMAKAKVGDAMIPGTHGSTFGGNPLAMRSANAVLDLLSRFWSPGSVGDPHLYALKGCLW